MISNDVSNEVCRFSELWVCLSVCDCRIHFSCVLCNGIDFVVIGCPPMTNPFQMRHSGWKAGVISNDVLSNEVSRFGRSISVVSFVMELTMSLPMMNRPFAGFVFPSILLV